MNGHRRQVRAGLKTGIRGWWLAAAAVLLLVAADARADSANPVQPMDLDALEQLMQDPSNRHMVVAMASWCRPCREELPLLNKLYERYKDEGVSVIGISLDAGGPGAMQPIVDKAKVTFPVYWVGDEAIEKFDIYAVPMLFFIKDGRVVDKIPGKRSKSYIDKKIKKLLK